MMRTRLIGLVLGLILTGEPLLAQGYNGPLTIQGLDRNTLPSAAGRGMGGLTIGLRHEVGLMFHNPATLSSLTGMQVSFGGILQSEDAEQVQHYAPVRYYSNFSLLMEGLTHLIPNPDPLLGGSSPADTVQRPFDTIGPNWSRSKNHDLPLQGFIAMPFTVGEIRLSAGVGAVEFADLHHYYQNNNTLTPPVFLQRPLPTFRPAGNSPVIVDWSQYIRSREGSLRGYGAALSGSLAEGDLSFGISGMMIQGTSDDLEQLLGRGRMTFFSNSFRLDSVYRHIKSKGSSDYSGQEITVGGIYRSRYLSLGFSAKLPTTITRTYSTTMEVDTTGVPSTSMVGGEDQVQLPWRGTVAFSLTPRENVMLGFEYEIRSYASAVYTSSGGMDTSSWLSSSIFHAGAEYTPKPWLALRVGIRGQAEVFEPEGNPIAGEPVTFSVYSAGFGLFHAGLRLNVAYEYSLMKYQDVWGSAVSKNSLKRNTIVADLSYELPWKQ